MNFRFEHIEFLPGLALLVVPVLLFLALLRWKARTRQKIGDPALVKELVKNYSPALFTIKFILLAVALGAIIALLPLALGIGAGAQLHQPLAIAVIGGFIAALPLLLIILPSLLGVLYKKAAEEPASRPL